MIGTPSIFDDFDFDMFHGITMEFELMLNLPWLQLQACK